MEQVSGFEINGKYYEVFLDETGKFHVSCDNDIVQPNHDVLGIIRYMSNIIHNLSYQLQREKK